MIYIFCSTTKQARQNVLFIGGHRILSPIKFTQTIHQKNHPKKSPEKFTQKIGQIPQASLSAQTP